MSNTCATCKHWATGGSLWIGECMSPKHSADVQWSNVDSNPRKFADDGCIHHKPKESK